MSITSQSQVGDQRNLIRKPLMAVVGRSRPALWTAYVSGAIVPAVGAMDADGRQQFLNAVGHSGSVLRVSRTGDVRDSVHGRGGSASIDTRPPSSLSGWRRCGSSCPRLVCSMRVPALQWSWQEWSEAE